ncbi:MAG: pilus assembly protein TadG-related protein [Nitratireductor sp.]
MSIVKSFLKDKSGNFAIIAGLSMFPLMLGAGIAIDYSRMLSDQKTVQHELDLAILAASHQLGKKTDQEIKTLIEGHLSASLGPKLASKLKDINIVIDNDNGNISASVKGSTDPSISAIAGYDSLEFDNAASIKLNVGNVEVALALDNTGSMGGSKLTSLKNASKSFVNSLFEEANAGKVKVGLIPFSQYVNVGVANRNASWMNVANDYSQQVCSWWSGCYTRTYTFTGCVGSRKKPFHLRDDKYTGNKRVPGHMNYSNSGCPNQIQPLTENKSSIISQLDAMRASGMTYIADGVMWGWRVLSKEAPFTEGAPDNDIFTKKILVLMTDGDNTIAPNLPSTPWHTKYSSSRANNWTKSACNKVKAEGIGIYTITFGNNISNSTKNLMTDCATTPENYFHASNSSALNAAFKGILNQLSNLFLSS